MSLVINAPGVELKLQAEAAKRGLSAADFAASILSERLDLASTNGSNVAPFYDTATHEEWVKAFDSWVNSHEGGPSLPESALTRESIYQGRV